ncbi:aldolase/citrate lyase family protein [Peristeroidobacter soli]|uniref:aldolase/citrate lyase family protein n=1 Tax=Peristeroidobacter soli TaxID=2497877 RepID=UPI00101C26C6|nr:aldolase/citrate lyase family protein [Peristeroidobacter soli]
MPSTSMAQTISNCLRAASMVGLAFAASSTLADAPTQRLNPVIGLIEQGKPVMGLYAPSNRKPPGAAADAPAPKRTPAELAKETVSYQLSDFVFDGSMEYKFDETLPVFTDFATALNAESHLDKKPYPHIAYPMILKIHEIAPDPELAARHIGQQLDLGVSGIMFVGVESPEEVKRGIAAMRYPSQGGTRADSVGAGPKYWGLSEKEYRAKADLWPLNPKGELINWVVVESKEGLKNVRDIAAVKGIGVLWPGAGTLRQVFSTTGADGKRVVDEQAWEGAIQSVLSACKEFKVPCGIPTTPDQIEMRMKQGFSVFVMNWGEAGFKTIEVGRKAAGRS